MLMGVPTEYFLGKSLWAPWRDPTPLPSLSKVPVSLCVGDAQGDSGLPFTGQSVGNYALSGVQKVLGSSSEECALGSEDGRLGQSLADLLRTCPQ